MELRQLEYLTVIAQEQNLSDAAKRLFVSQPTLSRALGDMERELGVALFDRVGRKLVINNNGRFFAKRAEGLLNDLEDACSALSEGVSARQRVINCVTTVPLGFLAALLKEFSDANPGTVVRMGYPESPLIKGESIDLQIFDSTHELPAQDNLVELAREEYVVVLPPGHRLENEPAVKLADLADDQFIMGSPSAMRTAVEDMFYEVGINPRVFQESYLYGDILAFVAGGNGCCIASPITWFNEKTVDCFTIKPIEDAKRCRILYAQLNNESTASAAAKAFAEFLSKEGPITYSKALSHFPRV